MDLIDTLSSHIETLSSDFLLSDPESTTDIDHLISLFSGLDEPPYRTDFPEIATLAVNGITLLNQIRTQPAEAAAPMFTTLGDLITDMQTTLRNKLRRADSASDQTFYMDAPSMTDTRLFSLEEEPEETQNYPKGMTGRLQHPGKLPDHLDNDVFAEFLTLQPDVIQKMETLILTLETSFSVKHLTELKRLIHTVKGEAGFLNLADVERLLHQAEEFLEPGYYDQDMADALLSMVDWLKKACEIYSGKGGVMVPVEPVIVRLKKRAPADWGETNQGPLPLANAVDETEASPQNAPVSETRTRETGALKETIAIDAERLDRIVNMIGELVIVEAMLSQSDEILKLNSPRLSKNITAMTKITRELQAMGLSLRMIPIRPVFQKMERLARDVAKKAGKSIRFVMTGEDTELDKTIVDKLNDPLMHLIRNAIDHGIEETEAERTRQGKPGVAIIALRAFHQGGNVHIVIQDDGLGLDPEKIVSKAIQMNLISESDTLNEPDILRLIFESGFSTAREVTEISGRGVGMNVVRERVEALRGTIHIDTKVSQGTTFSLIIPLTLAIIDGLIVRSGKTRYIIPALSVKNTACIGKEAIRSVLGKTDMICFMEKMVPLFRLAALTCQVDESSEPEKHLIVIVEFEEKIAAIEVDELIGKQQIVIKSLGDLIKNTPYVSGGAIMNDGQVGLILDIQGLVKCL